MNEKELEAYVDRTNSTNNEIEFTSEFEKERKFHFLDTTITRNIQTKELEIRLYRKETASERLLHYDSGHHNSIKINIIKKHGR